MENYGGNKTLLPLVPAASPFSGSRPILRHIIDNLPPGPKALVVNHRQADIRKATRHLGITYCEQPVLNGTGGALLAVRPFLESLVCENLVITMGDVPFVAPGTYLSLLRAIEAGGRSDRRDVRDAGGVGATEAGRGGQDRADSSVEEPDVDAAGAGEGSGPHR